MDGECVPDSVDTAFGCLCGNCLTSCAGKTDVCIFTGEVHDDPCAYGCKFRQPDPLAITPPHSITVQYCGAYDIATIDVEFHHSNCPSSYDQLPDGGVGTAFTITKPLGCPNENKLNPDIKVTANSIVNGNPPVVVSYGPVEIHTSCSQAIAMGMGFGLEGDDENQCNCGPFFVIAFENYPGGVGGSGTIENTFTCPPESDCPQNYPTP